jgi:hypothetical protein
MPIATFTLEDRWVDQFLSGMMLYHVLIGRANFIMPKAAVTLDTFLAILQTIILGTYDPASYFDSRPGQIVRPSLQTQPPRIAPGKRYDLIILNALTARSRFVSVDSGGLAFEEPVWAILAAHAVASKASVALPRARDDQNLWNRLAEVSEGIAQSRYDPQLFMGPIDGFMGTDGIPRFSFLEVEEAQLSALRARGMQTLRVAVPPKFFELYTTR